MEEASAARQPREGGDTVTSAAGVPQNPYKPIAETLKVSTERVCLFAVVAEIGAAVKSGGSDYTVTLRLVDTSRKAGISATFFAENTAQLPCVKSTGDVISLHNVEINKHGQSEFYVTFNKRFSSFALYESKVSAGCRPYQKSEKYYGSEQDKELLTQMRNWLLQLPNNSLGLKDLELQLSSLKTDSTFDLVCKVLHVLENNGKWIFYVWDGTDTPAAAFQTISDAGEVASPFTSPPLLEGPPLSRDVLLKMPCVGTVLRIFSDRSFFSDKSSSKKVRHMKMGTYWARFCNITCGQEFGLWKGIFSCSSRVRLLSPKDGSVADRLKMYDLRNTKRVCRRPMTSVPSNVTGIDHPKAAYSTLMESLRHAEVTHKVKTLVRVVGAFPCRPRDVHFLHSAGRLNCMLLTLEDPTARIHAYVHKDEMAKFLGGFRTAEEVIKKMNKLLGNPEAEDSEEGAPLTRNPPWIWCCLKSYYTDEKDIWGSRRYQIFETEIRD